MTIWSAALIVGIAWSYAVGKGKIGQEQAGQVLIDGRSDPTGHVYVTPTGDMVCAVEGRNYLIPMGARDVFLVGGLMTSIRGSAFSFNKLVIWQSGAEPYGDWKPLLSVTRSRVEFRDLQGHVVSFPVPQQE